MANQILEVKNISKANVYFATSILSAETECWSRNA